MGKELEAFYNENVESDRNPFLGRSLGVGYKYSEKTKEIIDKESIELVNDALETAKYILSNQRDKMDIIIKELLLKNTLYGKEVNNLLY
jgi:ATP-dependent Zn protease